MFKTFDVFYSTQQFSTSSSVLIYIMSRQHPVKLESRDFFGGRGGGVEGVHHMVCKRIMLIRVNKHFTRRMHAQLYD